MWLVAMSTVGKEIVEIELDKISTGTSQARQRDIAVANDDDLVTSIKKNGLLSPIIVKKQDDGKFEIVVGQRRFLAHKILDRPTIKACVLEGNVSELAAKRISLNENLARRDMKRADYVDAVQWFMDRYNSTATVAEEIGISPTTVRRYLSIGRLPDEIKKDIDQKKYETRHALKALDALGGDEATVDVVLLRETATELRNLSPQVQKKFVDIKKHEPNTPVKDVAAKAKKRTEEYKFTVVMDLEQYERVGAFQNRERLDTPERAAAELIDMGLEVAEV